MKASSKPAVAIGSKELVAFPDLRINNVPARIDTGAYGSSIWASNVHLEDGHLVFVPFAPGSILYREAPVRTTEYRSTVVKNSFGVKEFRYKVKLRVSLGDRTIRCWLSLADRSNNSFPVLLGRNFLRGRFMVDVSREYLHGKDGSTKNVLVLTRRLEESAAFFDTVRAQNRQRVEYHCMNYDRLVFQIGDSATAVRTVDSGIDIAQYGFTFLKNHYSPDHEQAYAVAAYLRYCGRPFADQEFVTYVSDGKLSEYMKLACQGLPVPLTLHAATPVLLDRFDWVRQTLGLPFVLKAGGSNRGQNNYIIDDQATYAAILQGDTVGHVWLAQKYVPNDGFFRIHALGKEVNLAVWRAATPHTDARKRHLNKPRGSANARLVPIDRVPGEVQQLALRAAACMNRQIAGVDLVQDKTTGTWYILEANNTPQMGTGSFVAEKTAALADFFDKELGR